MSYLPRNILKSRHLLQLSRIRCVSTKTEVDERKTELDFKTFSLTPRAIAKNPALPPVIKEFFVGEIHEGHFPFLEVVEKDHLDKFFKDRQFNTNYFLEQTKDAASLENLKQLGAFGYDVPQEFRGRGYSCTETALNAEIEAESLRVNNILNPHRLVTQIISQFGSDQQKSRYLRKLAEGELIGTVAIFENQPAEDQPFNTRAIPTNTGFLLTGEKDYVVNAHKANLLLVLASSIKNVHIHDQRVGVSAFLVDGNAPGVVRGQLVKTIGCEEVELASISFNETPVNSENLIGEVNSAQECAMYMLRLARLQSSVTANQLNKRILNHYTKFCIETKTLGGKPM